jgi:hypothetical protein
MPSFFANENSYLKNVRKDIDTRIYAIAYLLVRRSGLQPEDFEIKIK